MATKKKATKTATDPSVSATARERLMQERQSVSQQIERLREEYAAREKRAVEELDKAAKTGASGAAVASKLREVLGLTKAK